MPAVQLNADNSFLHRKFLAHKPPSGRNQNVGNKFINELVFFAFWILPSMKYAPSLT